MQRSSTSACHAEDRGFESHRTRKYLCLNQYFMSNQEIISKQIEFFRKGQAGCQFAARVSENPIQYGWRHIVVEPFDIVKIDKIVNESAVDSSTKQLSLLFPQIRTRQDHEQLLSGLDESNIFHIESEIEYNGFRLICLRAKILQKNSWVSGFAPLDFLPETREAPCTELVFRVKDKPKYTNSVQPPTPENELHVANLELPGISRDEFTQLWTGSFIHTRQILGHKPDLLSAAKTTFAIPIQE